MRNNESIIADIKAIAEHVRAVDPDDDQLLADMIEAETNMDGVLDLLLDREATANGHITALAEREKEIKERKARFKARQATGRLAMQRVLEAAQTRKVERPEGTISISTSRPKVIEGSVDALPDDLVRLERNPDKVKIRDALEGGANFPGWSMSNGGETVTVRRK